MIRLALKRGGILLALALTGIFAASNPPFAMAAGPAPAPPISSAATPFSGIAGSTAAPGAQRSSPLPHAASAAAKTTSATAGEASIGAKAPTVKPGDVIAKNNAEKVRGLVSPGNLILVKQGMVMDIVASTRLNWPPPYRAATEKYSAQVSLTPDGTLGGYTAGLPFPLLDPNDPRVAQKIMWNFSFRPQYNDDADARYTQVGTYTASSNGTPTAHFTVGHFGFYNNVGRIEVAPFPTDPDFKESGIRYRFATYPFLEPAMMVGFGMVRYRYMDPKMDDNVWFFLPSSGRLRRMAADSLSSVMGDMGSGGTPYLNTIDPDTYFGFSAKIEDFNYKLLGEKHMLACVHAAHSPEHVCPSDARTVCPENWEMRDLYVVEGDAKSRNYVNPRRVFYIDSEGWFMTAVDEYDRSGTLQNTIATFNAYRDRPVPDARVAIYPYKRMFQLALVDEDVTSGTSSIIFMPEANSPERECWYIDMGTVTNSFFSAEAMKRAILH